MATTIRVSESFHDWLMAHNTAVETVEQTLRRLILDRGAAGARTRFTCEDVRRATAAADALHDTDADRLQAIRDGP